MSLRGGLGRYSFAVLYVGLVVLPLLLGRLVVGSGGDPREALGSALGMAAFAMLLVGFWLSGRFQSVSGRAGLDLILVFHHYATQGAVLLVIAHVLVASGASGPSTAAIVALAFVLIVAGMAMARSRLRLTFAKRGGTPTASEQSSWPSPALCTRPRMGRTARSRSWRRSGAVLGVLAIGSLV